MAPRIESGELDQLDEIVGPRIRNPLHGFGDREWRGGHGSNLASRIDLLEDATMQISAQPWSPLGSLDMALAEIRILAPHGKAFALLQLFRKNHAGSTFLIQPENMARQRYSGEPWTIKNYREARDVLLQEGFVAIHEKVHGRATRYVLSARPLTQADRRMNAKILKQLAIQKENQHARN